MYHSSCFPSQAFVRSPVRSFTPFLFHPSHLPPFLPSVRSLLSRAPCNRSIALAAGACKMPRHGRGGDEPKAILLRGMGGCIRTSIGKRVSRRNCSYNISFIPSAYPRLRTENTKLWLVKHVWLRRCCVCKHIRLIGPPSQN